MNLFRITVVSLVAAFSAIAARAQLVHISATSDSLYGELVGYPGELEPLAGTAKFDLYYDASVVGTNGIFTFNDPARNYWTLKVNFTHYTPRDFSFALETLAIVSPTGDEAPIAGTLALRSPPVDPDNWWFDIGYVPSGPSTTLPVPPITFGSSGSSWNSFYVFFHEEGWEGDHFVAGPLRNFSAEIITPVPEPSTYGLATGIAALCFIVYNHRRRAPAPAA